MKELVNAQVFDDFEHGGKPLLSEVEEDWLDIDEELDIVDCQSRKLNLKTCVLTEDGLYH